MIDEVVFEVHGRAVPQGSKNPSVPTYKDGRPVRRHKPGCPAFHDREIARSGMPDDSGRWRAFNCRCPIMVNTIEDSAGPLKTWRETVAWTARQAMAGQPPLDGLLVAAFVFFKPRPKNHYGTGRNADVLKDSAPAAPGVKPDALKLARAVEDALTGIVYQDDSATVDVFASKRYCGRDEPEHVRVLVRRAEAQTVLDLAALGEVALAPPPEFEQLALTAA